MAGIGLGILIVDTHYCLVDSFNWFDILVVDIIY